MRTHEEGNNACDISINYFQTYKLEHLYTEDASFVFVETMMTSANLGAQVLTEQLGDSRWYLSGTDWRLFVSHVELP